MFLHNFEAKNVFFEAFLRAKNGDLGLFGVKNCLKWLETIHK